MFNFFGNNSKIVDIVNVIIAKIVFRELGEQDSMMIMGTADMLLRNGGINGGLKSLNNAIDFYSMIACAMQSVNQSNSFLGFNWSLIRRPLMVKTYSPDLFYKAAREIRGVHAAELASHLSELLQTDMIKEIENGKK